MVLVHGTNQFVFYLSSYIIHLSVEKSSCSLPSPFHQIPDLKISKYSNFVCDKCDFVHYYDLEILLEPRTCRLPKLVSTQKVQSHKVYITEFEQLYYHFFAILHTAHGSRYLLSCDCNSQLAIASSGCLHHIVCFDTFIVLSISFLNCTCHHGATGMCTAHLQLTLSFSIIDYRCYICN